MDTDVDIQLVIHKERALLLTRWVFHDCRPFLRDDSMNDPVCFHGMHHQLVWNVMNYEVHKYAVHVQPPGSLNRCCWLSSLFTFEAIERMPVLVP